MRICLICVRRKSHFFVVFWPKNPLKIIWHDVTASKKCENDVMVKILRDNMRDMLFLDVPNQANFKYTPKKRHIFCFSQLKYPKIVQVYGIVLLEDVFFIVMEFCSKGALDMVLRRDKTLTLKQKLKFAAEAARGMAYLHEKGVIHMDVKPQNFLVSFTHIQLSIDVHKYLEFLTSQFDFSIIWRIFIARSGYQPGSEIWNLVPKIGTQTSWAIFACFTSWHRSIRAFGRISRIFGPHFRTFDAHLADFFRVVRCLVNLSLVTKRTTHVSKVREVIRKCEKICEDDLLMLLMTSHTQKVTSWFLDSNFWAKLQISWPGWSADRSIKILHFVCFVARLAIKNLHMEIFFWGVFKVCLIENV